MSLVGELRTACEARVATATGYPAAAYRARANTGFDPKVGQAFVLTDVRPLPARPVTLPAQDARMTTRALFLIELYRPLAEGPETADTVAQAVLDRFPWGLQFSAGAYAVQVHRAGRAGGRRDGGWYHVPITITLDVAHFNTL